MTDGTIRVVLVDDQDLVRTGFQMIIDSQPDLHVVGVAADGRSALDLIATVPCDVVVMDVRMPRMDGVAATRQIVESSPDRPRILILTTFDLDEYVFSALEAGASGFLLKDTPPEELLRGIRATAAGDAVVGPTVTSRLIDHFVHHRSPVALEGERAAALRPLTPRESDVLIELAHGYSNAEISERLFLSEATVKTHVTHLLAKLGVRDRVQAVVYAHRHRLVDDAEAGRDGD